MMFSLIKLGYLLVTFIFIDFCKSLFSVEKYLDSFTTFSVISSIYLIFSLAILYHKNIDKIKKIEKYAIINIIYITFYYDYLIKLNLNIIDFYIINFFIQFLFILIDTIFTGICSCKNEEIEIKNKEKILPSREIIANSIDYYLENNIQSILIDGEWGSGKTFFIKDFLKKRKEKYIPIWIKSTLFESKNEIKKYVFEELKRILEKNRILVSPINDIMKKFEIIGQNSFINFSKCYSSIEEDFKAIKDSVSEIKEKKIVIIIDDLERISNKELAKDILSLISEIEENIDIKIFVLSSLKEFLKEKDYFDKYYEVHIKLSDISSEEIIEAFFDSNILKESINNFINELLKIEEKPKEIEDYLKKLENPRYLKRASIELNRLDENNKNENNKNYKEKNDSLDKKLHLIYTLISFQLLRKNNPTKKILELESNISILEQIYKNLTRNFNLKTNSFIETLKILDENNGLNYDEQLHKNKSYYEQGKEAISLGLNKKAIEIFEKAINLNRNNNKLLIELYLKKGDCHRNLEMRKEAIEDYTNALRLDSNNANLYFRRGAVIGETKDYNGELLDYEKALNLNPIGELAKDIYYNKSIAEANVGNYKTAILDSDLVIQMSPNDYFAYLNRGAFKEMLKDYEGAINDYKKVLEYESYNIERYEALINLKVKLGNLEEAITLYDEAINNVVQKSKAYYGRGKLKQKIGKYEEALEDYNKAIELEPNIAFIYISRGVLKAELNDFVGALADCNKAVELNPKLAAGYWNRGTLKEKMEDADGALKDYNKAIELNPQLATMFKKYSNSSIDVIN